MHEDRYLLQKCNRAKQMQKLLVTRTPFSELPSNTNTIVLDQNVENKRERKGMKMKRRVETDPSCNLRFKG